MAQTILNWDYWQKPDYHRKEQGSSEQGFTSKTERQKLTER